MFYICFSHLFDTEWGPIGISLLLNSLSILIMLTCIHFLSNCNFYLLMIYKVKIKYDGEGDDDEDND